MARWASLPSDWGQALRTPIQPRPSSRGFRGSKIEAMGAMGAIGVMATVEAGTTVAAGATVEIGATGQGGAVSPVRTGTSPGAPSCVSCGRSLGAAASDNYRRL